MKTSAVCNFLHESCSRRFIDGGPIPQLLRSLRSKGSVHGRRSLAAHERRHPHVSARQRSHPLSFEDGENT